MPRAVDVPVCTITPEKVDLLLTACLPEALGCLVKASKLPWLREVMSLTRDSRGVSGTVSSPPPGARSLVLVHFLRPLSRMPDKAEGVRCLLKPEGDDALRACLFEPVSGFLSKGGGRGECMKSSLISDATPTLPAFVEGAAPPACTLPLQCDGACWSGCVLRAEAGPRAEEARDRRSGGVVVCAGIGCWSSRLSICARVVDPGLP
mmetsp:Transcript_3864/g.10505  ORF Transcript_3864/g.10505 Transcript_3864/m.10505 type:complete len:206 (-) Transcript_3864:1405-2022(-)